METERVSEGREREIGNMMVYNSRNRLHEMKWNGMYLRLGCGDDGNNSIWSTKYWKLKWYKMSHE